VITREPSDRGYPRNGSLWSKYQRGCVQHRKKLNHVVWLKHHIGGSKVIKALSTANEEKIGRKHMLPNSRLLH